MDTWKAMLGNQVLVSAVVGWTVAQVLKTLIDFALNKSFNAERLVGSGGMPSSHSATVCGLTTAAGLKYGAGSFEFAISFILSMVVMYDAVGVRQETGKQARLLNSILLENLYQLKFRRLVIFRSHPTHYLRTLFIVKHIRHNFTSLMQNNAIYNEALLCVIKLL